MPSHPSSSGTPSTWTSPWPSRYDKGEPDFINCPLDERPYERFLDALLAAERAAPHDFDTPYFEACLPIEVMADRGRETLRYGPMKPVGLDDPQHGTLALRRRATRQDTLAGDHYNLVGFQTRLKWGAQRMCSNSFPGLRKPSSRASAASIATLMCRRPHISMRPLRSNNVPNLWIAGQLSGVEGYLESAAGGLAAAFFCGPVP